ncbi:MAG: alpha-ketoglutarate-dependent dioxygenase AlkB [Cyanobacteriota bacterium]|nr:alpha-ketoglutarate-dependent dioxygenase AlkB [Cyanobacteriota bacterium]
MMLSPNQTELDLGNTLESDARDIPGLTYIPEYINIDEQNQLLNIIDQQEWSTKLKRRVQHYGYRYDYKSGTLASSSYLGSLPDWVQNIANRVFSDRLTAKLPDQVIINEYEPGQGITSHVDCIPCFGNTIISLSLGSPCVMDFIHSQTKEKASILLLPSSLIVLHKAARYDWQHSIAARKKDNYKGRKFIRTRRVSMTFREVLFPYK